MDTDKVKIDDLLMRHEIAKSALEKGFSGIFASSISHQSNLLDRFSLSMLAASGAMAALLVSNLDSLIPYLAKAEFRISVVLLVISSLFGFASKYFSITSQMISSAYHKNIELSKTYLAPFIAAVVELEEEAEGLGIKLDSSISGKGFVLQMIDGLPQFLRKRVNVDIIKNKEDKLIPIIKLFRAKDDASWGGSEMLEAVNQFEGLVFFSPLRRFVKQCICTILQAICLIVFLLFITFSASPL